MALGRKERRLLLLVSIACFVIACRLPALKLAGVGSTAGTTSDMVGFAAFFSGFFAVFGGQFAWLANPLGIMAMVQISRRRYRAALVMSLLAILVAQQTWMLVGTQIDGDEGGVTKYLVTSLGAGFLLWVFCFAILAFIAIRGMIAADLQRDSEFPESECGVTNE